MTHHPLRLPMRDTALILSTGALLVLLALAPAPMGTGAARAGVAQAQAPAKDADLLKIELLYSINTFRAGAGLTRLRPNPRLACAAQAHARDLARRGRLDHRGHDGSDLTQRLSRVGYPYALAAENLAQAEGDTEDVLALWRASPGHDRNLRRTTVQEAGIGLAQGDDGSHFWVLLVAKKAGAIPDKPIILGDCSRFQQI